MYLTMNIKFLILKILNDFLIYSDAIIFYLVSIRNSENL